MVKGLLYCLKWISSHLAIFRRSIKPLHRDKNHDNPDKFHLLATSHNPARINIEGHIIKNSIEEKLLRVKTNSQPWFESHVSALCKKVSQKLHALLRITNYMDLEKLKCLIKTLIASLYNYCPFSWMFHSRKLNNRIS